MRRVVDFPAHFWSRVDASRGADSCWSWTGALDSGGYGQCGRDRRLHKTHRVAWMLTHGEIPDGLVVCHHCDNRRCCNPAHLFVGTQGDNVRDMVRKGRNWQASVDACPQGHALAGDNLYISARGGRVCRRCSNAASLAYQARNRDAVLARRRARHDPAKARARYLRGVERSQCSHLSLAGR
jgi:hypothetical protein